MKEDIIQRFLKEQDFSIEGNWYEIKQAIENLIARNKELEEKYIPKSKVTEKINEKIKYYNSYKGLEIYKKDNFKEIVITLEQLKQQLLQEGDK